MNKHILSRQNQAHSIIEERKKIFEKDELQHGCGYWSVCDEAGSACPCSPSAKVSQGFNNDVWDNMKFEMEDELRY